MRHYAGICILFCLRAELHSKTCNSIDETWVYSICQSGALVLKTGVNLKSKIKTPRVPLFPSPAHHTLFSGGRKSMKILPSKMIAVTICCLLTLPFSSAAQTNNNQTAALQNDTATEGQAAPPSTQEKKEEEKTPSGNETAPSLQDLGLSPEQTQGSAQDQARLDRRTHMLKIHQRLGLITTIPLLATFLTSSGAAGRKSSATGRDIHGALGAVTTDLYFTAAYFAIRAPRVPGTATRGPIRLHKALAWIHGPGMILTPILGAMAYSQENRGERVHGIAKAHSAVAIVTGAAYAASILSVSFKF
jgi:hypothetical protein